METAFIAKNFSGKLIGDINQNHINQMLKNLLVLIMLLSGITLFAQKDECKVLKPQISGTYQGAAKKGWHRGKGLPRVLTVSKDSSTRGFPTATVRISGRTEFIMKVSGKQG